MSTTIYGLRVAERYGSTSCSSWRPWQMASKVRDPINYFLLLRALFRSIGGGKFELLYKVREILGLARRATARLGPWTNSTAVRVVPSPSGARW